MSDMSIASAKVIRRYSIIRIWLVTCGIWLAASNCQAAPCYGTRMPLQKKFTAGLQTQSIIKRYLKDDYGKIRSTQHFVLLS